MPLADWSIRRKLALLIISACIFALVLASIGFALYERASFRSDIVSELTTLADTLGANTAASLAFMPVDAKTATDMLGVLRAEDHIMAACLYDTNGTLFAFYRRRDLDPAFAMPMRREDGVHFAPESVALYRSVLLKNDKTGSIAIVSTLDAFHT